MDLQEWAVIEAPIQAEALARCLADSLSRGSKDFMGGSVLDAGDGMAVKVTVEYGTRDAMMAGKPADG